MALPQGLSARQGPGTEMGQTSGDWGAEQVTKAGPLWSQLSDSALQCGLSQLCPCAPGPEHCCKDQTLSMPTGASGAI